ncbi:MAG: hypothetical protein IJ678_02045, partial [Kiritimatiellae bacterium]|nr:hypothetical protein [Kiritimatiellia bacterium]
MKKAPRILHRPAPEIKKNREKARIPNQRFVAAACRRDRPRFPPRRGIQSARRAVPCDGEPP